MEFGLYHEQIRRYQRQFPASQIHISLYEDLQDAPQELVSRLYEFLGVDGTRVPDVSQRHLESRLPRFATAASLLKRSGVWSYLRRLLPRALAPRLRALVMRPRASLTMKIEDRKLLIDYYREDIQKLELLLGRDLSAWLDPNAARACTRHVQLAGAHSFRPT